MTTTEHATLTAYVRGCRCTDCTAFHSAYQKARREAIKAGTWKGRKTLPAHGRRSIYNRGCRCTPCTLANRRSAAGSPAA